MSDDQMRQLFHTVLTAAPPDTTDVDAAVRAGRARRRRLRATLALSSVAIAAAAGTTATIATHRAEKDPLITTAAAGDGSWASRGVVVTAPTQLLGSWRARELAGEDVRDVRDSEGLPLQVTFERRGAQFHWGANDVTNFNAGSFEVSLNGRFQSGPRTSTLAGDASGRPQYRTNPEAVANATRARLVPATATEFRTLVLLAGDRVLGVYVDTGEPKLPPADAKPTTVIDDFSLNTHCGVRATRVGKDYYLADPILDDGNGNPPPGWANPFQQGTMAVYADGRAVFTSGTLRATFVLSPESEGTFGPCL